MPFFSQTQDYYSWGYSYYFNSYNVFEVLEVYDKWRKAPIIGLLNVFFFYFFSIGMFFTYPQ